MTRTDKRSSADLDSWVCVGRIGRPHGIKGEFRLQSYAENPGAIFSFSDIRLGPDGAAIRLKLVRATGGAFVASAPEASDRAAAEALRNKDLYARREAFGPIGDDDYYHVDLVGLEARDSKGRPLGKVIAVQNFGAGTMLEIKLEERMKNVGDILMLPFTNALVPTVDVEAGHVITAAREWLADEVIVDEKEAESE